MEMNQDRVAIRSKVWSNLRVPVRPGPEGLALYRAQMNRFSEKKILVLGATPELVDMAIELSAKTVVSIERDPIIIEAMRRLGRCDWRDVNLIEGDWLDERPEFIASFNCVVCDGGLLFLSHPDQWERLFLLVERYLTAEGVFVAKEWAEPLGERDFSLFTTAMIERFAAGRDGQDREAILESYRYLLSELWLASLFNITLPDGSFNQEILVRRLDGFAEKLCKQYPEPDMVEITRGALLNLARSRPGTTDVITGVRFDGVQKLLADCGLKADHHPLPDRPIHGGNYMFVARKSGS